MRLIFFTYLAAVLVLGSCSSGKSTFEHGNYYESVITSVNRLRKNKDHKKSIETLRQAYPLAVTYYVDRANTSLASASVFKWSAVVDSYTTINNMYDEIKRCPGALAVIPDPVNYFSKLQEARQNAAEENYAAGLTSLQTGNRDKAKEAYAFFKKANGFVPGYKDVSKKMDESLWAATVKVVVEPIPVHTKSIGVSAEFFDNKISEYLHASTLNEFVRFYTRKEAQKMKLNPDHIIKLEFDDFTIGQVLMHEKQTQLTKDSILVGFSTGLASNNQNPNRGNNTGGGGGTPNNGSQNNFNQNPNATDNPNTTDNKAKADKEKADKELAEKLKADREKAEKELAEKLKADKEKAEKELADKLKADKEKAEKELVDKEKAEKEKAEKEKADKEKAEKELADKLKADKEKAEKELADKLKTDKEKAEKELADKEKVEKEKAEKELAEKLKADKEKAEKELADKLKAEKEKAEKELAAKEKADKEKTDKEKAEKELAEKLKADKEKAEKELAEKLKADKEKAEKELSEKLKADKEKADKELAEKERADKEKADKELADKLKAEKEKAEKELADKLKAEKEKAEKEKADNAKNADDTIKASDTTDVKDPVTICHIPPGNTANNRTLKISRSALKAHLDHGDSEGSCESLKDKKDQKGNSDKNDEAKPVEQESEKGGKKKDGQALLFNSTPIFIASSDNDPFKFLSYMVNPETDTTKIYGTVKATLYTYRKTTTSKGTVSFKIIDSKTGAILSVEKMPGEFVWISEWATFNGDERALSPEQLILTRQKEKVPPPPQDLFTEFTKPIYDQVISKLQSFYKGY